MGLSSKLWEHLLAEFHYKRPCSSRAASSKIISVWLYGLRSREATKTRSSNRGTSSSEDTKRPVHPGVAPPGPVTNDRDRRQSKCSLLWRLFEQIKEKSSIIKRNLIVEPRPCWWILGSALNCLQTIIALRSIHPLQ